MKIEKERIYINGFLEPLKSENDKKFTMYPNRMIPIHKELESYHVDIDGLENRGIYNNKLDIFTKVDLFNNRKSSGNITDLFSMLYYDLDKNITTYTHYSTIRNFNFCPNELGLLDIQESYKPLALHEISKNLYIDIYEKQTNLLNILSH